MAQNMIRSMTGYGRGEAAGNLRTVTAEIRAVNHRYCEISVRMPSKFTFAEEPVRAAVRAGAQRGKIDVTVSETGAAGEDTLVSVNAGAAKQYFQGLRELQRLCDVTGDIELSLLAGLPDVFCQNRAEADEEALSALILAAVRSAILRFDEMRLAEGEALRADLLRRLAKVSAIVEQISARAPEVQQLYVEKLRERIRLLTEKSVDTEQLEQRLAMEIAVFADKASVDEELVRLASHTAQFQGMIAGSAGEDVVAAANGGFEPVGKKLDFLVQEMNREANTIGSKANDLLITDLMIDLKSEIENIREQVQNIC